MPKKVVGKTGNAKTEKVKKTSNKSEVVDDFVRREEVVPDMEWKERLLRIHNQQVKLEYMYEIVPQVQPYTLPVDSGSKYDKITLPNTEEQVDSISLPQTEFNASEIENQETISTANYRFDKENIELETGVFVKPLTMGGMVSKKGEPDGGNSVVFFSPGGKMLLKPSNMGENEEKEAELAMLHFISIQDANKNNSDIEISAYLREPVVFNPQPGYEVELNQGEYTKRSYSEKGSLKFWDTKIKYNQNILVDKIEVEMDGEGILKPSNKRELKDVVEQYSSTVLDDEALKAEFDFKNTGEWLKTYYVVDIGSTSFYLKAPERKEGVLLAKSATADFYGFSIELEDITVKEQDYIEAKNGKAYLNDNDVKMSNVKVEDNKSGVLNAKTAETEIEGFTTIMNNYKFDREWGALYESATVKTQLNFGKNSEKPDKSQDVSKEFVDFYLGSSGYMKEGFQQNVRSQNIGASKKLEVTDAVQGITRESSVFEESIFTRDGFAKLEDAEFEFIKEENENARLKGEGKVKFLKIPYNLVMKDDTTVKGEAYGKDAVEKVKFNIDNIGNLSAEFESDAEVTLNLNNIGGKENESESIIRTFTMGDLSIDDGYLNAGSLRMDRGFNVEQEGFEKNDEDEKSFPDKAKNKLSMDDKLLKIFNCKMSGTVATKSEEAKIDLTGIQAKMKKTTFGKYKVEDFMGFLGGEIDYPAGKIEVSAKKEVETENPEGSFFQLMDQNISENIYIPTGIPGVQVKFGFKPSASIAGEIGFSVERGKSFDEKWEDQDELKLGGEVKTEGKASIAAEAGVELGVPVLANVDFKVGGELGTKIEGGLSGETKFKYEEKDGKLRQSDDFEFEGKLGGNLKGALNLSSNVKFLFWNKQLFSFELLKKELGKLEFNGAGSKDHNQKGLTKGWNIKSGEFSASWFSKEIGKKYKNNQSEKVNSNSSEELKKLVENSEKETEDAWAVLCELKEKRDNTLIILNKDDKEALDVQIETVTKEVIDKVQLYISLLTDSQKALDEDRKSAQKMLEEFNNQKKQYEKKSGVSKDVLEKAEWGGFKKEEYEKKEMPKELNRNDYKYLDDTNIENKKMQKEAKKKYENDLKKREELIKSISKENKEIDKKAAVDLMIARILGEVSDENLKRIREEYDYKTKNGNPIFAHHLFDTFSEEDKIYQYCFNTEFVHTGLSLYESQSSFYSVLNEKAIFERREFRNSYDREGVKFKRTIRDFPKRFRFIVENNPRIKMKDLLKCVLKDEAPDGKKINATPEEKLELLYKSFGFAEKITLDDRIFNEEKISAANIIRNSLAVATGEKFKEIFSGSLEDVVKGESVINIFDEMDQIEEKLLKSDIKVKNAENMLKAVQKSFNTINEKKGEYSRKLILLQQESKIALKDKDFNSNAAKNVVDIYSKEYVDKMKSNTDIIKNENIKKVISWVGNSNQFKKYDDLLEESNTQNIKSNFLPKGARNI